MSENNAGLYDWDLGRYPKLKEMNNKAEKGDLTDEELSTYSKAAKAFYGSYITWVENDCLIENL